MDWLVLGLTGSSTAVGVTTAPQFLPLLLFGLYGGVLVDRLPKRPILAATQVAMALTALALALLTLTGRVHVWHVYAAAFPVGLATVLDNPARQSFLSELVGPELLRNALGLNSANFQSARLIGPAVAGLLITGVGTGWAFLLNGVSFAAPLACMMLMRRRELHPVERAPNGKGQLRESLRYVAGRLDLVWPIVLVGFFGTFALNFPVHLTSPSTSPPSPTTSSMPVRAPTASSTPSSRRAPWQARCSPPDTREHGEGCPSSPRWPSAHGGPWPPWRRPCGASRCSWSPWACSPWSSTSPPTPPCRPRPPRRSEAGSPRCT